MLTEEKIKRLKRIGQKEKDHKLRQLYEEQKEIWKIWRESQWVDLEEPIRNGYVKYFVLRDDIARRSDAHVFEKILKVINNRVYARDPEFKVTYNEKYYELDWRNRIRKKRRNIEKDIPHELRRIGKGEWDKLGWPEHFKKYFSYRHEIITTEWGFTHTVEGWVFNYPFYFVAKVEPHFITKARLLDPELESREKQLWNRIHRDELWPKIIHLVYGATGKKKDEWYRPKHVQERLSKPSDQKIQLQDEGNNEHQDMLKERLLRRYLADKYGECEEPWDDPYYVFNESTS